MNTINDRQLSDLLTAALESIAFVLAERIDMEEAATYARPTHFARIAYSGANSGEVILGASDGFLRELASSLLGVEPEEINVEEQGCDALRELANIVGGSVVFELDGEDCRYTLGLPEPREQPLPPCGATCESAVESEGEVLIAQWHAGRTRQSTAA